MSKQFWGIIAIIVLIFVGIFALSGSKSDSKGKTSTDSNLSQHFIGNTNSGVTLVEYGDFQCPFCGEYYPTVKQVQTEFNDQMALQFRNFPLVNVHQNAFAAARAAEAASKQNKFWEMHDMLYENQTTWSSATDPTTFFNAFASTLGLNLTKFKADYASSAVNDTINADMAEGNKLNIQGTPTFFLNGKQIQVSNSVAAFEAVIKPVIAKQAKTSGTATPTTTSSGSTAQTPASAKP